MDVLQMVIHVSAVDVCTADLAGVEYIATVNAMERERLEGECKLTDVTHGGAAWTGGGAVAGDGEERERKSALTQLFCVKEINVAVEFFDTDALITDRAHAIELLAVAGVGEHLHGREFDTTVRTLLFRWWSWWCTG